MSIVSTPISQYVSKLCELLFHFLKIITCTKQWKDQKVIKKPYAWSLLTCNGNIQNKKEQEQLCAKVIRPIFTEIS